MQQGKRTYRKRGEPFWPREAFIQAVAESHSISGVLARLGASVSGTNYRWVHRLVEQYQLDTAHWLGQAHLRGRRHNWSRNTPFEQILVERSDYANTTQLKRRLIRAGLLREECSVCGIREWLGQRLALHLDHINGVGDDHRIGNLRLLCPNCHSQTETYCGRNMRAGFRGLKLRTAASAS